MSGEERAIFLHHFDFFGAEAIERVDERIHLSFLTSDFGVERGKFTFEGHDLQDHRGAVVHGQFTERVAEFFAGRPFRDGKGRRQHFPLGEDESAFDLGDNPPSWEDRLGPDYAPPSKAQIVETLSYRGSGVSLPLLIGIQGASDSLNSQSTCGVWPGAALLKWPIARSASPLPPFAPEPGIANFG